TLEFTNPKMQLQVVCRRSWYELVDERKHTFCSRRSGLGAHYLAWTNCLSDPKHDSCATNGFYVHEVPILLLKPVQNVIVLAHWPCNTHLLRSASCRCAHQAVTRLRAFQTGLCACRSTSLLKNWWCDRIIDIMHSFACLQG